MERDEEVWNAIKKIGESHKDEVKKGTHKVVENMFQNGMMPKNALGISDQQAEQLYTQAYQLFNSGNYRAAMHLFDVLILLDVTQPKYMFGLAACRHMLGDFEDAADTYMGCAMLDPENPVPFFHASDCWMQLNEPHSALVCLRMTVRRSGDNESYATIKDRALLTIQALEKQLQEESQPAIPKEGGPS